MIETAGQACIKEQNWSKWSFGGIEIDFEVAKEGHQSWVFLVTLGSDLKLIP